MRSLTFVLFCVVAAGCDVGDVTGGGLPDAREAAGASPDADPAAPDGGAALACRDAVGNPGNGEHNAGQACIACHAAEGGPTYTLAGTLYGDAAGAATLAGATITVVDAQGTVVDLVTRTNGNFFTSAPLTFPVQVMASRCPDAAAMAGAVTSTGGDCNSSGCHAAGAPSGRIHLP